MRREVRILIIVLAILLLAGQAAHAEDAMIMNFPAGVTPPTRVSVNVLTPEEARARQINDWAASGYICEALGHKWVKGFKSVWWVGFWPIDEYAGGRKPTHRKCLVCDKVEERIITRTEEWR